MIADEAGRLRALNALQILGTDPAPEFDILAQLASRLFAAPIAAVSFVDERRAWFKAAVGLTMVELPRDAAFCTHAIERPDRVFCIPDTIEDARFADHPLVVGMLGIRFYAGMAVVGPTGHPVGTLCVMDTKPRFLDAEAIAQFALLASTVTTAIRLHDAQQVVLGLPAGPARDTPAEKQRTQDLPAAAFATSAASVAAWGEGQQSGPTPPAGPASVEDELRFALAQTDETPFKLAIQPMYELARGKLIGFEALVRWVDPVSGRERPPGEFLAVAESSGLVVPLDRWVCEQACQVAAGWPDHLAVSINVSTANFFASGFADAVRAALKRHRLAPERLKLEITEIAFLREPTRVRAVIAELQELGVKVVVDDFGSGRSSMAYLRDYTFDGLKIDRVFTAELEKDPRKLAVVQMIVEMADTTGISVTVEGVETRGQLNLLRATRVDSVQGFLFGRPCTPDSVSQVIAADVIKF